MLTWQRDKPMQPCGEVQHLRTCRHISWWATKRHPRSVSCLQSLLDTRTDESKDPSAECDGGDQGQGSGLSGAQDTNLSDVGKLAGRNCLQGSEMHRKAKHCVWLSLQVIREGWLGTKLYNWCIQDKLWVFLQHDALWQPSLYAVSPHKQMHQGYSFELIHEKLKFFSFISCHLTAQ